MRRALSIVFCGKDKVRAHLVLAEVVLTEFWRGRDSLKDFINGTLARNSYTRINMYTHCFCQESEPFGMESSRRVAISCFGVKHKIGRYG